MNIKSHKNGTIAISLEGILKACLLLGSSADM
jgi:hypothetical protein